MPNQEALSINLPTKEEKIPYSQLCGATSFCQYRITSGPFPHQLPTCLGKPTTPRERHQAQSTDARDPEPHQWEGGRKNRLTLCNISNSAPSFENLYVLRYPLEQDLGEMCVSAAVPTTRCRSPFLAANGTMAIEKADSFPSR